ncbi:YibE/F family protein [Allostreptomyces psammosilenae]|uniref:YibE/F family protein n=1 Tax=Allostreptomyces psammosilenae TaxID=1892865 RepID=UPI00406BCF9F
MTAVLLPFLLLVIIGLLVLWPGGAPPHERTGLGFDQEIQHGEVTRVEQLPCSETIGPGANPQDPGTGSTGTTASAALTASTVPTASAISATSASSGGSGGSVGGGAGTTTEEDAECTRLTIRVTTGPDTGLEITQSLGSDQVITPYEIGEGVVLAYNPDAEPALRYSLSDRTRGFPMVLLAALFALAVVVVGGLRGVTALVALVISFLVLTLFVLPAILQGSNPLLVAVVGGGAIMLVALYLCHGFTARTSVAVLGTLASLALITLLGWLFIEVSKLTGLTSDEVTLVHGLYPDLDVRGLLLAGFVIGSLGVLDDVTVTQTSAVWELKHADPSMSRAALYRAGLRIGRDHIASTVNTLVLAYAGAAMPLLLLFTMAQQSVWAVATSELIAEEVVRTLVGSIGLVASVPLTTALAAIVAAEEGGRRPSGGAGGGSGGGGGRFGGGAGDGLRGVAGSARRLGAAAGGRLLPGGGGGGQGRRRRAKG